MRKPHECLWETKRGWGPLSRYFPDPCMNGLYLLTITVTDNRYYKGKNGAYHVSGRHIHGRAMSTHRVGDASPTRNSLLQGDGEWGRGVDG